jgi:CubicO group peptidase (beta-lactamase class C family)
MKLILSICLFICSGMATAASSLESVSADIERLRVADSVPSIAVAVAQHGKIVWEAGFGWADRENRIPANQHTMYSLASISKPITATGLMLLVQAGQVNLDKSINDYLGDAKVVARIGDARDATVRRIANHTSGLPVHSQFFFVDEPYRSPSVDETILRYGNLVTKPGERFQYSNIGFGLLGDVISRTSGQSFDEFMRQYVFQCLGMTHTSVGIGPGLESYQAIRYDQTGGRLPFFDTDTEGASAVYSSAHDLVRFGMFHLKDHLQDQNAILSDASIDAMHQPTAEDPAHARAYGMGWEVFDRGGGYRMLRHRGGMPGVATLLELIPSEDIAVVVLSNGVGEHGLLGSPIWRIGDEIMRKLLPRWSPPAFPEEPKPQPFTSPRELTGSWNGMIHTYAKDLPVAIQFFQSGDVHIRLGDQPVTVMSQVSFKDGWLRGTFVGDVGTSDVDRHSHYNLECLLRLRGNVLNGGITASTEGRRGFELTQWLELTKSDSRESF